MDVLGLIATRQSERGGAGNAESAPAAGMGVSEIAEAVGLHVATTHNILRTLAGGGFLVNLSGRYHIGPEAARLAGAYRPLAMLGEAAAAPMARMSQATGETGFLAALGPGGGFEMEPISRGASEIAVQAAPKRYANPLAVACGRLLAALEPEARWEDLIAAHLAAGHDGDETSWRAELEFIRRRGCCVLRRPRSDGVDAVAVALPAGGGSVAAALGASCPNFRGTPEHLAEMLAATARAAAEIAAAMGQAPQGPDEKAIAETVAHSFL